MKKTILSLGVLLTISCTYSFAQTATTLQQGGVSLAKQEAAQSQSLDISPREAVLNISYKMTGGKMLVMADDHKEGPIFVEKTASTLSEDTYQIYNADGKSLIATYTVGRKATDITLTIVKGKTVKEFALREYLARATSDLERDAIKRKLPVYWLYKNGYAK